MQEKGYYKIRLSELSSEQKDAIIQHLDSLSDALVLANNELINRLRNTSEPIADIINQWLGVCNNIQLASGKEMKLICGKLYERQEGSTLQ